MSRRLRLLLGVLLLAASQAGAQAKERDPEALALASVHVAFAPLEPRPGESELLVARDAQRTVPIASVTKLMTGLVVVESGADLDEWLTIEQWDPIPPNNRFSRLRPGSQARRRDLLRMALQASENLAAHTLARHHPGGRDAFVAAMNATAERLGMAGSHFVGATGLSPGNVSSAADLLRLLRQAHAQPLLREYSTARSFDARFRSPGYGLHFGNTNRLLGRSSWQVELSKTGYLDEAGRCLVMVVELEGRDYAMVLLDSFGRLSPIGDAGRLRRWLATGDPGRVAPAAARYAQTRGEEKAAAELAR